MQTKFLSLDEKLQAIIDRIVRDGTFSDREAIEEVKSLVLESLLSKQFHGSSCIDSDCEDEDHGYYAVRVGTIKELLG